MSYRGVLTEFLLPSLVASKDGHKPPNMVLTSTTDISCTPTGKDAGMVPLDLPK